MTKHHLVLTESKNHLQAESEDKDQLIDNYRMKMVKILDNFNTKEEGDGSKDDKV